MHRPELCFKQPLAKGLIPFNRTVPVRPRSYASNMGLRNALSNKLRLSPMQGAALSTTLLDPLQRPGACNDHGLRNSRALLCKVCQPTPPAERRAAKASKLHTCQVCKLDKARDDYWSKDYYERNSPRAVLSCKSCNPTPPEQRQPKQMGRPAKGSSQA